MTQITLRFVGDWPVWVGWSGALVLALVAFFLYRRDLLPPRPWVRTLLPTTRAFAVAMIVLMLAGPVLHHRQVIGELPRLLFFVDGSRSMQLTDSSMSIGRKISILQKIGLLARDAARMELPRASEALVDLQLLSEKAASVAQTEGDAFKKLTADCLSKSNEARELIAASAGNNEPDRLARFEKDLLVPVREISGREFRQMTDRTRAAVDLGKLSGVARRWQEELSEAFQKLGSELSENSSLRAAVQKFDTLPRAERVQALLLSEDGLIHKLSDKYAIELAVLDGEKAKRIWQSGGRDAKALEVLPELNAGTTNLSNGIKGSVGELKKEERGAVVLISDGQHNEGESPVEVARMLGARKLPVYTVGVGSQSRPRDLAIVRVDGPDAVFYQDRVRGQITLKDDMPAGMPYEVMIQDGERVLWKTQLISDGTQVRKVPFDFVVKEAVEARLGATAQSDVQRSGVPLELKVSVSQPEGDREPSNNVGSLRFRAVTQKRKVLIVDGRGRWETRYLRNLFERDEQWEVNSVVAGSRAGEAGLARGSNAEEFPTEALSLNAYDLIVFGEVPQTLWRGDELQWIADFVAKRGGALLFLDGPRGALKQYAGSVLAPLLPVEWSGPPALSNDGITRLVLSERGAALAPFTLVTDRGLNAEAWTKLQPPHWLSGATPLPGAEVLLNAEVKGKMVAAVVLRAFGAGKVLYQGFDDSWRWRFEVADEYHVRYWNQVANWIAELPFAVRDKFVSLDAGAATYRPGDSAEIRVRLRDGNGRPVSNASVDAVLTRGGQRVATLRLAADDNAGGLFRGKTAGLEPGDYEVAIESAGIPQSELKARAAFKVEARETGELTLLNLNEELLRQMALESGGQYLREENAGGLVEMLAPLSQATVIETDTALGQSWWWFTPIVALFTLEWIVRKRVGML